MSRVSKTVCLMALILVSALVPACGFDLLSPFGGFGGETRLKGQFVPRTAAAPGKALAAEEFSSITVFVREHPEITATVEEDGFFLLVGLPPGTNTLVFVTDTGRVIGEIRFNNVEEGQDISILVRLTPAGLVVLIQEERDGVIVIPPNGSCDAVTSGKITVCHQGHSITISASAWPAHRDHGDTCGPCSDQTGDDDDSDDSDDDSSDDAGSGDDDDSDDSD
jgi:hypothetical protein